MGVPPGNRRVLVSVPGRYVAGADTRGRREGRPYPWSQQVIHEISGLGRVYIADFGLWIADLHFELPPLGRVPDLGKHRA
jgi:hypothetical protein